MWFQQEGATAHTANQSMITVRNMFPWAPHFPFRRRTVTPLGLPIFQHVIILGGYLKSRFYAHKPRKLNDLKEAIRQEIHPIDSQLLARIMDI